MNSPQEFPAGEIVPVTCYYLPFNRAMRGPQGDICITDRVEYEKRRLTEGSTFPALPELGANTRWVRIKD